MGNDVSKEYYSVDEYDQFRYQLRKETQVLKKWFKNKSFEKGVRKCGIELEGCLIDKDFQPCLKNNLLISDEKHIDAELSKFNFEIHTDVHKIQSDVLTQLNKELKGTLDNCQNILEEHQSQHTLIGILPTITQELMNLNTMSEMKRYKALNHKILEIRKSNPIKIDINGEEHLHIIKRSIMMEAVTTSLQIHVQVSLKNPATLYNIATLISGPMVGISANAPILFDKILWDDTRIPIFEQSVSMTDYLKKTPHYKRVTLGHQYINSLYDLFSENMKMYPILLPEKNRLIQEKLFALRLHNGTIWRWNRPKIGWNENGVPNLRIEHRVMSAGPTIKDVIANTAFFIGLLYGYLSKDKEICSKIPFTTAKHNFYEAAKHSLDATLVWKNRERRTLSELCINELIPIAKKGLRDLGIIERDIQYYLKDIIYNRVKNRQNGAIWQKEVFHNNHDVLELIKKYVKNQQADKPVHEWD